MSRSVLALDRLAALLLGLVLLVVGLAAAAWYPGWLARPWPGVPQRVRTGAAGDVLAAAWWPWAAGGAGVVLVLLALWWLLAHLPRRGVGALALPGSTRGARLLIEPDGAADTAAEVLARAPGVRSASARVLHERGRLVVALKATVEPDADLAEVVSAADAVTGDLAHVLGRADARARVRLEVARSARHRPRAR
ncbi:hypothetical protein [Kineococcus indalonis]|uniref:hypothetical protein n=1 Tax=Kineococcus indalonis TaxID=2696566 RepID=UPI001412532D|nr:hypothetical protein [Kineococcus indalonis]NAZ87477.1 hypothetical protein [Kineococcus indalonis]